MPWLTFIICAPLLMALVLVAVPRNYRFVIRSLSQLAVAASLFCAIAMFVQFDSAPTRLEGFKFVDSFLWIDSLGISYTVGVDGLNVGLILMAAIVAFAAVHVSNEINRQEKEFYILLLVMIGGIFGAFASLDLFFFYFFHELALVPTFLMIGLWGRGEQKNFATFQITLYLSFGALLVLAGLSMLYVQSGTNSFDIRVITSNLQRQPLSLASQNLIFPLLLFGFGILVSLWPFHSWAPLGYGSAPSATSMLHAGVLKKFGLYGLLRVAIPLMPQAAQSWFHILTLLCLGNILYCGWVAMRQKDLNLMIGNSSVAHMGFIFLGLASWNVIGVSGAVMVMIAHGLLAALSFALTGYLHQQAKTLEIERLGGLLRSLPFVGTLIVMAFMAGCGLPGFGNFAGEVLVLFGAYKTFPVITSFAVWGALVIGGVYMLRAIRNVLHGPIRAEEKPVVDLKGLWRRSSYLMLVIALLLLGCFPSVMMNKIKPRAQWLIDGAKSVHASQANR